MLRRQMRGPEAIGGTRETSGGSSSVIHERGDRRSGTDYLGICWPLPATGQHPPAGTWPRASEPVIATDCAPISDAEASNVSTRRAACGTLRRVASQTRRRRTALCSTDPSAARAIASPALEVRRFPLWSPGDRARRSGGLRDQWCSESSAVVSARRSAHAGST